MINVKQHRKRRLSNNSRTVREATTGGLSSRRLLMDKGLMEVHHRRADIILSSSNQSTCECSPRFADSGVAWF